MQSVFIVLFMSVSLQGSSYFKSPQESVEIISQLLLNDDWKALTAYYYTENLNQEIIDSLLDGSYFINTSQPEIGHPAVNWKYRKPFPPTFKYSHFTELANHLVEVTVSVQIDQGNEIVQTGFTTFTLIKGEEGFQIVP